MCKNKSFPVLILRPYQIYGPNQDLNRFIPIVIDNCLKNKIFPCSEGSQRRDFLYIDDFVKAVFKLIINKKISGEIFNIGAGKTEIVRNVIFFIKNVIKKGYPNFGKVKMRKEENMVTYPNIKKIKRLIKWSPKIKLRRGIISTISYYKKIL